MMRIPALRALSAATIFLVLSFNLAAAELFTLGIAGYAVGSALLSGAWYKWDTVKENTYCRFKECCNSKYIPYDLDGFKKSLSQKMFGQPLVNELVAILQAHRDSLDDETKKNRKAEVISLHGWSGTGKNFAVTMIADALYKNGMSSEYVLQFQGQKAIDSGNIGASRQALFSKIKNVVSKCSRALIIFDEVDEMDAGIIDGIKPMLDHHRNVDGVDYRNCIFIFISNIGGKEIAMELLELYKRGVKREEVGFQNFEPIIRRMSFYTGGFNKSAIISNHLIDHYVPFLPLEQRHVEACARAEFRENLVTPTDEMMTEALSVITFGPTLEQPIFANNGCKRFTKHVPFVIEQQRRKSKESEVKPNVDDIVKDTRQKL